MLQKCNYKSDSRCTNSLWTVGLAAFRRASRTLEQHDLLNATYNIPLDWGWGCINCRVATYSTNSAITITGLISQVNTQHSWGHKAYQTVSLLGRARSTNPSICPCSFAQILISHWMHRWGNFIYALFTITVLSAVGGTVVTSVLCGHVCRMYLGRKCTWLVQNISEYQAEEWDHMGYTSFDIRIPSATAKPQDLPLISALAPKGTMAYWALHFLHCFMLPTTTIQQEQGEHQEERVELHLIRCGPKEFLKPKAKCTSFLFQHILQNKKQ